MKYLNIPLISIFLLASCVSNEPKTDEEIFKQLQDEVNFDDLPPEMLKNLGLDSSANFENFKIVEKQLIYQMSDSSSICCGDEYKNYPKTKQLFVKNEMGKLLTISVGEFSDSVSSDITKFGTVSGLNRGYELKEPIEDDGRCGTHYQVGGIGKTGNDEFDRFITTHDNPGVYIEILEYKNNKFLKVDNKKWLNVTPIFNPKPTFSLEIQNLNIRFKDISIVKENEKFIKGEILLHQKIEINPKRKYEHTELPNL